MALFRRILSLGRRARMEQEIDAELREHMAMCIDDNMAQGMSREEAERDARRRFGSPTATRERVSAEDTALGLESFWHDLRRALRVFVKSPGFALVVVTTLALGIGANTAIFELIDAVRLRVLPIARPGELAACESWEAITESESMTTNSAISPCPCGSRSRSTTILSPGFSRGAPVVLKWALPTRPATSAGSKSAEISSACSASFLCRGGCSSRRMRQLPSRPRGRQLLLLENGDGRRADHAAHHHPCRGKIGTGSRRHPALFLWNDRGRALRSPIQPALLPIRAARISFTR